MSGLLRRARFPWRGILFAYLLLVCAVWPQEALGGMVSSQPRFASESLLPHLEYFVDATGSMDVDEVASPVNARAFQPWPKDLPPGTGTLWLRFTLAPLAPGEKGGTLLLDMGADVPADPVLYEPRLHPETRAGDWRESVPGPRNILLLPEPGPEPLTCYIRMDGLPGVWFAPVLRTPHNAATNWSSLVGKAAILALGVVIVLCVLRGLSEKGQWRVWTALYVAFALAHALAGMPPHGGGGMSAGQAFSVLFPGMALMLFPHVGRHLMGTRGRSRALDAQLVLLSLPGAVLALLPLLPGFGWLIRYLALWPACTLLFAPTALGAAVMGLGGARRFLLACLISPLCVFLGFMGLTHGQPADLLASAPLWGTALGALLVAGTGLPGDMSRRDAAASTAELDAALISAGLDDNLITLDQPLDDPNLRILPPGGHLPSAAQSLHVPSRSGSGEAPNPEEKAVYWENLLRPALDSLLHEGMALKRCALPPAVRLHAEKMLDAAQNLARTVEDPGKGLEGSRPDKSSGVFNLQQTVREAHDAVALMAENAGIGLAWYMPPLMGHMYEGQGQALGESLRLLLESAVRATGRGVVHLSVRRVPESADAGHLLFTVSDSGNGLPPQKRSVTALARAWELAGDNGGYLALESGPQGVSVSFSLRLVPLEERSQPGTEPVIAVVADSAVERRFLINRCEPLGCRCVEARSVHEALQYNREAPAVMLVVRSPHDGPAHADALGRFQAEALAAGLPVFRALAITADSSRWDALTDCGYTHALLEPLDEEALVSTVREVLDELRAAAEEDTAEAPRDFAPPKDGSPPDLDGHSPLPDLFGPLPSAGEPSGPGLPDIPDLSLLPGRDLPATRDGEGSKEEFLPLPGTGSPDKNVFDAAENASAPEQNASGQDAPVQDAPVQDVLGQDVSGQDAVEGDAGLSVPPAGESEEFFTSAGLGGPVWGASAVREDDGNDAGKEEDSPAPAGEDGLEASGAEPLATIADRSGEAVLKPLNASAARRAMPENEISAPPAGRGAWANYSMDDEWVGEPVPVPASASAEKKPPSPQRGTGGSAPFASAENSRYVSPSPAVHGEWVGEPVPVVSRNREPSAAGTVRERPSLRDEMPRTAPGREIRRVMENTGESPRAVPAKEAGEQRDSVAPLSAARGANAPIVDFIAHVASVPDTASSGGRVAGEESRSGQTRGETPAVSAAREDAPLQDFAYARLVEVLDASMEDVQQGYRSQSCPAVQKGAARISAEAGAHGFRVLARLAHCVERAAKEESMSALRDLLPELAAAVERDRIDILRTLRERGTSGNFMS